jgi:succinyl-CoA synthetase beta subunit
MKIHEYQAKELFKKYGVAVPDGTVATTGQEARKIAQRIGNYPVVVKAQIHAGGRGKGGGVKLAQSDKEVSTLAQKIIGMTLVTRQTGLKGQRVKKVLVEKGLDIKKELYLSFFPDRTTAKVIIMVSEAGGMDIEAVAEKRPEKIITVSVDPLLGIKPFHCRQAAFGLNLMPATIKPLTQILVNLYQMFVQLDLSLLEINPLGITMTNEVIALDAKINFDSNALFRHKEILAYRDPDEEDPLEVKASKYNLNYINLDGNVGNMVNGAGLAMATMDIIKQAGAKPANFLDVGGGASAEMVKNGFEIILSDPNVKGILINIFGGILRCDILAKGVVQAAQKTGIRVPVVVRMEGTNVKEGRKILSESKLNFILAADLKDAAQKVAGIGR